MFISIKIQFNFPAIHFFVHFIYIENWIDSEIYFKYSRWSYMQKPILLLFYYVCVPLKPIFIFINAGWSVGFYVIKSYRMILFLYSCLHLLYLHFYLPIIKKNKNKKLCGFRYTLYLYSIISLLNIYHLKSLNCLFIEIILQ